MKPVQTKSFWKNRINTAEKEHYSVYVCHEGGWDLINQHHKKVLSKLKGKILDAGCGYGRWSELFDDYVGVDLSPDFIEKAKEKYPDKKFMVGKLQDLPFKDNEFDWAFCVSIKAMIIANCGKEEWDKMEKELKRVAKKVLILEYEDYNFREVI